MFHGLVAIVAYLLTLSTSAFADNSEVRGKEIESLRQQGYSVHVITPIFNQLLMVSFPRDFKPAFVNTKGNQYIQESVLDGESTKKWSQMITLTGAKGLASNRNVTPQIYANSVAGGFKRTCPDSFSGTSLGALKISGHDAFVAVISCGAVAPAGEQYSETALVIVVKGENDYYTIQWAERGDASRSPITFDKDKWTGRIKRLAPIKLCPIVPGESAPYPSCTNRKVSSLRSVIGNGGIKL